MWNNGFKTIVRNRNVQVKAWRRTPNMGDLLFVDRNDDDWSACH